MFKRVMTAIALGTIALTLLGCGVASSDESRVSAAVEKHLKAAASPTQSMLDESGYESESEFLAETFGTSQSASVERVEVGQIRWLEGPEDGVLTLGDDTGVKNFSTTARVRATRTDGKTATVTVDVSGVLLDRVVYIDSASVDGRKPGF